MTDPHPREALMQQALAHAQQPMDARIMLTHLLLHAQWHHIEQALEKVHYLGALADQRLSEHVARLAELEVERVRLFDPEHPGE